MRDEARRAGHRRLPRPLERGALLQRAPAVRKGAAATPVRQLEAGPHGREGPFYGRGEGRAVVGVPAALYLGEGGGGVGILSYSPLVRNDVKEQPLALPPQPVCSSSVVVAAEAEADTEGLVGGRRGCHLGKIKINGNY